MRMSLSLWLCLIVSTPLFAQSIQNSDAPRTRPQAGDARRGLQSGQPGLVFQDEEIFPHLAIGGVWSTQMTFLNLGSQEAVFPLRFTKPNGDLWVVAPDGVNPGDNFTVKIPAGSSFTLNLPSRGSVIETGWADITQPTGNTIGAHLIFTDSTPGRTTFEAVVPLSSFEEFDFLLPFDNTNFNNTCIALANPVDTNPTTVTIEFRDEPGNVLANATRVLDPFAQQAFCLVDEFPQLNARRGFAVVRGSQGFLSALGLRFLPGGAFTSFFPMSLPPAP